MRVQLVRDMTLSMSEGQMTQAQLRIAGYGLFLGIHLTQDTTVRVFQGVQLSNLTMAQIGESVAYRNTRNQVKFVACARLCNSVTCTLYYSLSCMYVVLSYCKG